MTIETCGRSSPLDATSVATRTRAFELLNCSSAANRWLCFKIECNTTARAPIFCSIMPITWTLLHVFEKMISCSLPAIFSSRRSLTMWTRYGSRMSSGTRTYFCSRFSGMTTTFESTASSSSSACQKNGSLLALKKLNHVIFDNLVNLELAPAESFLKASLNTSAFVYFLEAFQRFSSDLHRNHRLLCLKVDLLRPKRRTLLYSIANSCWKQIKENKKYSIKPW